MKSKRIEGSELERHPLYGTWVNMKCRCYVKGSTRYKYYGSRGIKVCDRWLEPNGQGFWNFVEDMGKRPENPGWWNGRSHYYTIDRRDVNGDYTPENARWASRHEQAANIQDKSLSPNLSWNNKQEHWEARIQVAGVVYRKRVKDKDTAAKFLKEIKDKYGI